MLPNIIETSKDMIDYIMKQEWHPFKMSLESISGHSFESKSKSYCIPFNQYKTMLERYSENPILANLPENLIDEWINIICYNTALIYCFTVEKRIYRNRDVNINFISDYGVPKILNILKELTPSSTVEEKLLIIDRVLNVVHGRGSMAYLFIEGGEDSLNKIRDWKRS